MGQAIGRNQAWVSRYLGGDIDADLETLEQIARVFGHTLNELLDVQENAVEAEILDRYRALTLGQRSLIVQILQQWTPQLRHTRGKSDAPADGSAQTNADSRRSTAPRRK